MATSGYPALLGKTAAAIGGLALMAALACGLEPAAAGMGEMPAAAASGPGAYHREAFGGWIDADHDGCDTRQEVLEAAAGPDAYDGPDRDHCRDDAPLYDVYTGSVIPTTKADIDHALPLEKAWEWGMAGRPHDQLVA